MSYETQKSIRNTIVLHRTGKKYTNIFIIKIDTVKTHIFFH